MKLYSPSIFTTAFVTVLALSPLQATTLNLDLDFKEESALTALTDKDWVILKETAMEALDNSPDGSTHIWKNEQSGNSGVMTVLSTDRDSVIPCRNTDFFTTAGGISSSTTVKVCKRDDGTWSAKGPLATTSGNDSADSFGQTDTSTEISRKTLGQTSEHCVQLSQDIERLKGKPLQRSAARDLYQAECLR